MNCVADLHGTVLVYVHAALTVVNSNNQ